MNGSIDLSFLRDRAARKRIAITTAAFVALGLAYALLAPRWYRSVLTVVPAKPQKGAGLSAMMGDLGGLAAGFEGALGGADGPRIAAVLQSVAVTDAVIEKFDLRARYDEKYQETARAELWRHCDVKAMPKPNLVQLTCEDKDPRFVQQMLEYFADYGNQVFRRVGVSSATEEVRFLEGRVAELRAQADAAAAQARAFEEKHQIVDLETQSKAVVTALASLNSQRIGKQLELDYAGTFSSWDEASQQQLRSQISVIDDKLRDLEQASEVAAPRRRASGKGTNGMFPAALSVPKLRAEYEKLFRDRKVAETTLVFALERLEAAKANEARDVSTFLVLDPPALPQRHARPMRSLVVGGALLLGLLVAIGAEWVRSGGLSAPRAAAGEPRVRRAGGAR